MTTPPVILRPGQRLTADVLNLELLRGTVVFAAYRDATQSITSGDPGAASNALSWDNVPLDLLGGWSAGTPTRYTPTLPGRYQCTGSGSFSGNVSGSTRGASWRQNGTLPPSATVREVYDALPNQPPVFIASPLTIVFNGSTDYLELCPFQNSGSSLDTGTGSNRPFIAVAYCGPE